MNSSLSLTVDEVRAIEPRFAKLEEAPIHSRDGATVLGWHSNAMDGTGKHCLGGGLAENRDVARRVALAETMERACFRKLFSGEQRELFALASHPTTCGFAAGFEFESTRMRSICEAIERWARVLWIDQAYFLTPPAKDSVSFSPLSQHFLSPFENHLLFSGQFSVRDPIRKSRIDLRLGVVIGLTTKGVFSGARVCPSGETPWEHACLEAWRHHAIFKNGGPPGLREGSYLQRISYFGSHRDEAMEQVERAHRYDWPEPEISVHQGYEAIPSKLYVWRSLCGGYAGFESGPVQRFVY